jgi:SAM-dependent methyltransferase
VGADLREGDAARLPWNDGSFDLVLQSTVFSSILDRNVQAAVAREMRRVLAPGGLILSYDLAVGNPRNLRVRGVRSPRLAELFPGCEIHARRVTLAPPIARRLAPRAWLAAEVLEATRVLSTHLVALIIPGS